MISADELMRRARAGDPDAFGALAARYRPRLERFARRLLRDPESARDAAQEALLRLWSKAHLYEPRGSFEAFLYTLATRVCLRAMTRERGHVSLEGLPEPQSSGRGELELGRMIAEALAQLPDDQRLAFVLSEYEGLSYEEIAAVLQCPKGTVGSRKHAAVRALRQNLLG